MLLLNVKLFHITTKCKTMQLVDKLMDVIIVRLCRYFPPNVRPCMQRTHKC